jgi:hypothetical protein
MNDELKYLKFEISDFILSISSFEISNLKSEISNFKSLSFLVACVPVFRLSRSSEYGQDSTSALRIALKALRSVR